MGIIKRNLRRYTRRIERRIFDRVIGTLLVVAVPGIPAAGWGLWQKTQAELPGMMAGVGGTANDAGTPHLPSPTRTDLTRLTVNDTEHQAGYNRNDWPHFLDPDRDGCHARNQALRDASLDPPALGPSCDVKSGRWPLVYIDGETSDPRQLDIDHVLSLSDAHRSGGWAWTPGDLRRIALANDPLNLIPVALQENRSKSDKGPDQWRPKNRGAWCLYSTRYTDVAVKYELTVTSAERASLEDMQQACP